MTDINTDTINEVMHDQRSPEWFAARIGRVTGSMVGAVLGLSPFMTRDAAMRNMVREALGVDREFQGNVATQYGASREEGAMFDFTLVTDIKTRPAYFIQNEDWLGASPDGWTSDGGLIEVKCPFGKRNDAAPVFKSPDEQPHYLAQMQVQMYVARVKHCHFWQWSANGHRHDVIAFDQDWIDANLPRLRQFHAEYLDEVANNADEHLAPLRTVIDTPGAHKMVAEWDNLNEAIELATARKKDLLSEMVALAHDKNALIAGRKLSLTSKIGAISYAKAIKELLPDTNLEKWRGKPSSFWGLR